MKWVLMYNRLMRRQSKLRHKFLNKRLGFLLVFVLIILLTVWLVQDKASAPGSKPSTLSGLIKKTTSKETSEAFDKTAQSINDPTSLWVVANKGRALPANFVPAQIEADLRHEAAAALAQLISGAKNDELALSLYSGYRSYADQTATFNGYAKSYGQTAAENFSARPGHSEHQTGLAADLAAASGQCTLEICFGEMKEGKWLAANAHKFGFIIRYQNGKEALSGYQYEPWHLRFVGVELAAQLNSSGQTMEEFFGLPSYTDYIATPYQLKAGN